MAATDQGYTGLLLVGDPHLEGRVPGFRKDDYPRAILGKLGWCLAYAREQRLLPALLGDIFHLPRDNQNWMLCELMALFDSPVLAVYGNHDCRENTLTEHDTLSILVQAGKVRLLEETAPWRGLMSGRPVIVGGTAWGRFLPRSYAPPADAGSPLVVWLCHHDVKVPGYEEQGRFAPYEIPGVDVVVNGHIHRQLEDAAAGRTRWITPGNISRRSRSDVCREHVPAALRLDVGAEGFAHRRVEVPHRPFAEVFFDEIQEEGRPLSPSAFVAGLAELQARRSESGAGLMAFLEKNLAQFDEDVAVEIRRLAIEVTRHEPEEDRGAAVDRDAGRAL